MLWNRRHVAAFGAVFVVAFIFLAIQLQPPASVTNLMGKAATSPTSQLHLLIPAGNPHVQLCRAIVSSLALGYPVPIISGWNLQGELDAAVTHLAKVRNIMRYLDNLPSSADNDLILIIDGYDVFMQLPADIMIKRYFEVVNAANARLETRLGKLYMQSMGGGLNETPRQTILFGPDKICWPVDWRRTACWAVPTDTNIPVGAFGVEDGDMSRNQPRWLNSGTIMGPIGDMRMFIAATLERMRTDYDPNHPNSESDQMYMSDLFGDQEYYRSVQLLKENAVVPTKVEPIPQGGPEDKLRPQIAPRQKTEYRIAIEYESALFQTRAGNEVVLDFLPYDGPDYTTPVRRPGYSRYLIALPKDTISSLTEMFKSISSIQVLPHSPAELVASIRLGTNLITRQVFALYHCTGEKTYLHELWPMMWFFPYLKSLLKASIVNIVAGKPLSEDLIDGRVWVAAHSYPAGTPESPSYEAAGAWADVSDGWLSWRDVCEDYEDALFIKGWRPPVEPVEEEKLEEPEKPEEKVPEETKPEEKKPEEKKPEEKKPEEKKPEEKKPEEKKPEEKKPEEKKPEEKKPEEKKPEEKKPEVKPAEVKPAENKA